MDVYLQPHSDDICFSLGGLAERRRRGVLLTALPISGYVPLGPGQRPPSAEIVTQTRMQEDRAFSQACGLEARFLAIPCGSSAGYGSFDLDRLDENLERVKAPIQAELLRLAAESGSPERSWLFCPAGIGGHVDHVAILKAIVEDYDRLSERYRIAFYEDLHYASNAKARKVGIARLRQIATVRRLRRRSLSLGAGGGVRKRALINLYPSQFLEPPRNLKSFTPAVWPWSAPHEAIWSEDWEAASDLDADGSVTH